MANALNSNSGDGTVSMPGEHAEEEEQDGAVDFTDLLDRSRPAEEA